MRLKPECECCGRHFTKKNKRALSVSFGERPKQLNKCKKCDVKAFKLRRVVKRKAAAKGDRSAVQATPLHSAHGVHQASQEHLHRTNDRDITVRYKPPCVRKEKQERSNAAQAKTQGKFLCPICDNVAIKRRYSFSRHMRSHYRDKTLVKATRVKKQHTTRDGTAEEVAEALDEDSVNPPKIAEIVFHGPVLLTCALWAEYEKNWQSIRSHQHIGATHRSYNFRLTSINLQDLFPLLRRMFTDQPSAFKFNIGFAFILHHRSTGVNRYIHANDDTARFFETAMPVHSKADFGDVLSALAVPDLYQWTYNKRIRSRWHVAMVTNATAVISQEQ